MKSFAPFLAGPDFKELFRAIQSIEDKLEFDKRHAAQFRQAYSAFFCATVSSFGPENLSGLFALFAEEGSSPAGAEKKGGKAVLEVLYSQIINSSQDPAMLLNALGSLRALLLSQAVHFVRAFALSSKIFDYLLFLVEDHICYQVRLTALDCLAAVCSFARGARPDAFAAGAKKYGSDPKG